MKRATLLTKILGRYGEALEALDGLLTCWPELIDSEYFVDLLDMIILKANADDAVVLAEAWILKARVLSSKGDRDNAWICLSRAIAFDPKKRRLAANDELLKDLLRDEALAPGHTRTFGAFSRIRNLFGRK